MTRPEHDDLAERREGALDSREALTRLAEEQAALRRVATLVVGDTAPADIFAAVSTEVDHLLGLDPATYDIAIVSRVDPGPELVVVGISKRIELVPLGSHWPLDDLFAPTRALRTGRSARVRVQDVMAATGEMAELLQQHGYLSQVSSPIVVDGRLWGTMSLTGGEDFPPDTEERLESFTELVATAIANAESRETLARIAEEQAALRNLAVLVAEEIPIDRIFTAVCEQVGHLLEADMAALEIFPGDGTATLAAVWSETELSLPVGRQVWVEPDTIAGRILSTRAPARRDRSDDPRTRVGPFARDLSIESTLGAPILVGGRIWGALMAGSRRSDPWAKEAESRLSAYTELVATAIANAESRGTLTQLADQQAALGRVATLVAEGAGPADVFNAVAWEVAQLFDFAAVTLSRYEDDAVVVVADPQDCGFPVGSRWPFDGDSLSVRVRATRRMARIDDYSDIEGSAGARMRERDSRSAVGVPIVVEGSLWGILCVGAAASLLLPADIEARIAGFVELVGTAIANGQARDALHLLADEQAALRRVATLVARGAPPGEVFDAVAMEVGKLLDTDVTAIGRYDNDRSITAVGSWSASPGGVPVGTSSVLGGRNVATLVAETAKPARVDAYDDDDSGEAAKIARRHGWYASIAAPILVEGRLWGNIMVATKGTEPFPAGAEERLSAFTDHVATAIANAESKSELAASRLRIVAAADEARRRIERDLHDGIQQRLIALSFRARAMIRKPPEELPGIATELSDGLKDVSDELREISRGIHPTILTEAGLGPALRALARRSNVPIDVDVTLDERLPASVEAAAYYIASEALTNVAKHAQANVVELSAAHDDGILTLEIRDDGIGGVDARGGSGILGLTDRVEALGGTISIVSPPRGGTTLSVRLPPDDAGA